MALGRINSPSVDTPKSASDKLNANADELEKVLARLRYGLKVVVSLNNTRFDVLRDGPFSILGIGPTLYSIASDTLSQTTPAIAGTPATFYVHAVAGSPVTFVCNNVATETTSDRIIARMTTDTNRVITLIENWPDDDLTTAFLASSRILDEFVSVPTTANTGDIITLLSRIVTQIRRFVGTSHWYDDPTVTGTITGTKAIANTATTNLNHFASNQPSSTIALNDSIAVPWKINQNAGGLKLQSLANPTASGDAVNLAYLNTSRQLFTIIFDHDSSWVSASYPANVYVPYIPATFTPLSVVITVRPNNTFGSSLAIDIRDYDNDLSILGGIPSLTGGLTRSTPHTAFNFAYTTIPAGTNLCTKIVSYNQGTGGSARPFRVILTGYISFSNVQSI